MFEKEKAILQEEAGSDRFLQMLARQTGELMDERRSAGTVGKEGRTLKDLKKIFDKFAEEHKTGKQSVITPNEAAEMICDYFELSTAAGRKTVDRIDIMDML